VDNLCQDNFFSDYIRSCFKIHEAEHVIATSRNGLFKGETYCLTGDDCRDFDREQFVMFILR
jgi:hypothetical protein